MRRKVAMMTEMLPKVRTLRTAIFLRKLIWQFQSMAMGRRRMYMSRPMFCVGVISQVIYNIKCLPGAYQKTWH